MLAPCSCCLPAPPRAARSAQTRLSYPKPWLCAFQLEVAELWCVCSALNTATKASQGIIIIIWALGPRDTPSATRERDDQRVRCRERTTRLHTGHQHLTRFLSKTTETPQEGRKCTGHLPSHLCSKVSAAAEVPTRCKDGDMTLRARAQGFPHSNNQGRHR